MDGTDAGGVSVTADHDDMRAYDLCEGQFELSGSSFEVEVQVVSVWFWGG